MSLFLLPDDNWGKKRSLFPNKEESIPSMSREASFSPYPGLKDIKIEELISWLSKQRNKTNIFQNQRILENKLGNRILYPQTIPVSLEDLKLDLGLLKQILDSQPQNYYNQHLKRLYIPEEFLAMFPDLQELILLFIDIFNPSGITSILAKGEHLGPKNLGTLIKPKIVSKNGQINIWVKDKKYQVRVGDLTVIPVASQKVDIKFESKDAELLGKKVTTVEIFGGQLGLIIDGRKPNS